MVLFKKYIIIIFLICFILIAALIFKFSGTIIFNKPIYIGVACPLSGKDRFLGKEMLKGINLFTSQYNKKKTPKISLIVKDDKNDKSFAMKVASEFALDNKTAIVLGHYFSSTSIFAGKIYKKNGLPAITASATASKVTFRNEWYFRIIPNNAFQSHFLANYVKSNFKKHRVFVIYNHDDYGSELADSFIKALKQLNIPLTNKWGFTSGTSGSDKELSQITSKLTQMYDSGVVFIATHYSEAIKIITSLKYPGSKYTILGPDSFSSKSFIDAFNNYPRERAQIGYYSDNIFTVVSSMHDIQSYKTHAFNNSFKKKYKEIPSSIASVYYDAIYTAVQAIKRSGLNQKDYINVARKKVKDALCEYNSYNQSIDGVTGRIFFNEHGDVDKPIKLAFYKKQNLFPCFQQYVFSPIATTLKPTIKDNQLIKINNTNMKKVKIVYAGIDFAQLSDLDIKNSTCQNKFYIWFRFAGEFDPNNIRFMNAIEPVSFDDPIFTEEKENITTSAYLLKGTFKIQSDYKWFSSDIHDIQIKFCHKTDNTDHIIFIPDPIKPKLLDNDLNGFHITGVKLFQTIYKNEKILDPTKNNNFSVMNVSATLQRSETLFFLRNLIPIIFYSFIGGFLFILLIIKIVFGKLL